MLKEKFSIVALLALLFAPDVLGKEPTVGLITAFGGEYFAVVNRLEGETRNVTSTANRLYTIGELAGVTVVVTISGVGMTNGAMTTQNMMDTFPDIKVFMFSGIAGGVNPENHIGDVVIPQKWAQHQHQKFIRQIKVDGQSLQGFADGGVDYPLEFFSGIDNSGPGSVSFMRPKSIEFCSAPEVGEEVIAELQDSTVTDGFAVPIYVDTFRNPTDALEQNIPAEFWFYPDQELMEIAKKVLKDGVELENSGVDAQGENFELQPHPVFKIVSEGVSASTFVDNAEYRIELFKLLRADCVDMESAAFMHVCASNGKRCLVIRSISDLAGGDAGPNVINNFITLAAGNSVRVLEKILQLL